MEKNGFNGAAGEIGHLPLVEGETESCNCGKNMVSYRRFAERCNGLQRLQCARRHQHGRRME